MTEATFVTSMGSFTARLMPEHAPKTVANFVGWPWTQDPHGWGGAVGRPRVTEVRIPPGLQPCHLHRVVARDVVVQPVRVESPC